MSQIFGFLFIGALNIGLFTLGIGAVGGVMCLASRKCRRKVAGGN